MEPERIIPIINRNCVAYIKRKEKAKARKRKFLDNMTQEQKELKKTKDREYYHRKKSGNKTKSINDMSEREKGIQKKTWRENSKKYRQRKKSLANTLNNTFDFTTLSNNGLQLCNSKVINGAKNCHITSQVQNKLLFNEASSTKRLEDNAQTLQESAIEREALECPTMSLLEHNETKVKQDEDMKMNTECRACLQRFEDESGIVNLFETWTPPWDGMNGTIADDLNRLSNVQVSESDEHSKVICRTCHQKLLDACTFVSLVQRNDQVLKQRYARPQMRLDVSSETIWPKPIQVDKNINKTVIGNIADIEIKQEVLSEDEYTDNANGTDLDGDNVEPILDLIKIEPEEFIDTQPHIIKNQKVNQSGAIQDVIHKNEDILSDSSPDRSNSDTNYTSSTRQTDESDVEVTENLDACALKDQVIESSEFHSYNNDKDIEVIQTFDEPTKSDSCHNHISNSPINFVDVNDTFTLPTTSLVNESVRKENSKEPNTTDNTVKDLQLNEHSISENIEENPTPQPKSEKRNRIKDFCIYCKSVVLNFARHLYRVHLYEPEVKVIMSKPKKSLERKRLLNNLRKRGNFIQNSKDVIKPMRKEKFTDYLPCTNCLGFYSRKNLWRHAKKCIGEDKKTQVQSDAQNFLVRDFKGDKYLQETVFPRMRPDKISLVAKSDKLICYFASQYIKIHKEKHVINVASRKMRELAKLLQEIKIKNPHIKDLFDALRSKNYDIIVEAAKVIGKYDIEKDRYESPSLVMNISNNLKHCCKIAMKFILKRQGLYRLKNTRELESDLEKLIKLLGTNWRNDILSQAAMNLNEKKNNTMTIASSAYDLKICKDYLKKKTEEAALSIKNGIYDVHTYIKLLEMIYCKVLLLNICRPGELQKVKIHDYLNNMVMTTHKYDKFVKTLNASEHTLLKKFKVVISSKFVLFNDEVQEDIMLLLSIREHYLSESNNFLFSIPGLEILLCGYEVIKKHVKLSNVKNPNAIFSTKLRIAALTLISSMSKNDLKQLTASMGPAIDDIYETAKILKLILHIENGNQCNEKTLEPGPSGYQQVFNEKTLEAGPSALHQQQCSYDIQPKSSFSVSEISIKGKKRCLVPWTEEQKIIVITFFKDHITNKKPPKRHECESLKQKHPELLNNKDWLKIKVFIQNVYSKRLSSDGRAFTFLAAIVPFPDNFPVEIEIEKCAVINGFQEHKDNINVDIKKEPLSDEADSDSTSIDLSLECMLCAKEFKSIRGLKAHVIAQHSYKSVRRKTNNESPVKKEIKEKHICATCRRSFETSTDLMVHETCHNKSVCYGCNQKFDTFDQLAKHRKRCKAISNREITKPKTLDDVKRHPNEDTRSKNGPPPVASTDSLACSICNEKFSDEYYKRIHEEVHHSVNETKEKENHDRKGNEEPVSMETEALEDIFNENM